MNLNSRKQVENDESLNLKYLGGEILENGGKVDRSAGTDTLGILSGLEKPGDSSDGELKTGF